MAIFIQSGIKWLDRDFPQGKKACQTRTAQRTASRAHCFSLKFRCFFRHDRISLMRAKSAAACCAGAPGAGHLLLPWGYSCGRRNPKNKGEGCSTLWRARRKTTAARQLPPRALPDFRRPPALPPETVTWYFPRFLVWKGCKKQTFQRTFILYNIVPRLGGWLPRGSSTKFVSCNLRRMFSIILVQNCLCKSPAVKL